MDQTSITAAGVIDTFLVLLIGIGPKLALVPFVEITSSLDAATKPQSTAQTQLIVSRASGRAMVILWFLRACLSGRSLVFCGSSGNLAGGSWVA